MVSSGIHINRRTRDVELSPTLAPRLYTEVLRGSYSVMWFQYLPIDGLFTQLENKQLINYRFTQASLYGWLI